jgi:hypothetical protein
VRPIRRSPLILRNLSDDERGWVAVAAGSSRLTSGRHATMEGHLQANPGAAPATEALRLAIYAVAGRVSSVSACKVESAPVTLPRTV